MEHMNVFCTDCDKMQPFEIVDMEEGEDCWKLLTVKCLECGKIEKVKIYA